MENQKMLFFLNPANPAHRILRRAIVIGIYTMASVIIWDSMRYAPEYFIPIMTAIGAMIDKGLSELKKKPKAE